MLKFLAFFAAAIFYGFFVSNYVKKTVMQWFGGAQISEFIFIYVILMPPVILLVALAVNLIDIKGKSLPQVSEELSDNPNFRLWAGRISMWKGFWLGYVPYAALTVLGGGYAISIFRTTTSSKDIFISVIALLGLFVLHGLALLGVWRSSMLHKGIDSSKLTARSLMMISSVLILCYWAKLWFFECAYAGPAS